LDCLGVVVVPRLFNQPNSATGCFSEFGPHRSYYVLQPQIGNREGFEVWIIGVVKRLEAVWVSLRVVSELPCVDEAALRLRMRCW
jgi:hypothetical protein